MLSPADADQLIFEHLASFLREDCPLEHAVGRILRADLRADRDLPPFDRVTMDGYAVRTAAIAKGERTFRVEGTQAAGMRARALGPGDDACVEVMTGAVLPEGADGVVPYEETKRDGATMSLVTADPAALVAGVSVHRRGSDHRAGDVIVPAGATLSGREIAVAAAVGAATLTVATSPRIAVVATGDELVEVGKAVAAHQIRRSNDYALSAGLVAAGFPRVERFHLRDLRHEIEHRFRHLIAQYDVVLVTGGVSKGKYDFIPDVLAAQGARKIFHGVAQRPGKPLWFGVSARHTPIFALPGNPVASYTLLHRYVLPALRRASGATTPVPHQAVLAAPVKLQPAAFTHFLPVRLTSGAAGELLAAPVAMNTSGDFAGLVGTDGFVELPVRDGDWPAGFVARFFAW